MNYTHTINSGQCEVYLSGKFMFSDHQKFKTLLSLLEQGGISSFILDFQKVEYIDSAGLGMLLMARDEAEKKHIQIILRKPVEQVAKMFSVSEFDKIFSVVN